MNKNIRLLLFSLLSLSSFVMTGCYEEPDLISDITTSKGKVAQVSVVWLGTTRTTTSSSAVVTGQTVNASAATTFNIEYTTLVPVKEFKVYWAATATGAQTLLTTVPAGGQQYDPAIRCYVVRVPVTAQDTKRTTRVFFAEIVTENGLSSDKKSAVLTTNP
jgi:hypothetical protein